MSSSLVTLQASSGCLQCSNPAGWRFHRVWTPVWPITEMTAIKCIEMFAEAIPDVIIQLMAIITTSKKIEILPLISVGILILSTGFVSASISYD